MIIDFHTHVFPPDIRHHRQHFLEREPWFGQLYANPKARLASAEDLICAMDAGGVDRAVIFGFAWTDHGLCQAANDYVIDSVRQFPERLNGFISVNPHDVGAAQREIERCVAQGLSGIGELMPDAQQFSMDDAAVMSPLAETSCHHHLPILTHITEPVGHIYAGKGEKPLRAVVRFAEQFPDVTLVCAHWGGGLFFYELMPELLNTLRNVYYDTAASHLLYRDRIFRVAGEIIPDKILFGTDYSLVSPQTLLRRIRALCLPASIERNVLGETARRVLRLP